MQITTIDMINNRIKRAKFQLSQHRTQGVNSRLSVHDVAKLMDTVRKGEELDQSKGQSIFFSLN
ncbi:MAG: hypothetical protein NXI10_15800 [bacterium]|nr:hypothetical protein [bacterium]